MLVIFEFDLFDKKIKTVIFLYICALDLILDYTHYLEVGGGGEKNIGNR